MLRQCAGRCKAYSKDSRGDSTHRNKTSSRITCSLRLTHPVASCTGCCKPETILDDGDGGPSLEWVSSAKGGPPEATAGRWTPGEASVAELGVGSDEARRLVEGPAACKDPTSSERNHEADRSHDEFCRPEDGGPRAARLRPPNLSGKRVGPNSAAMSRPG